MEKIDKERMCCFVCGYIAPKDEPYVEEMMDDGEGFPVCNSCGSFNCGGYPSFAPAFLWSDDDMVDIVSRTA